MTYLYPDSVLMLFCKAPVPGQVKTRLMAELSAGQAADIHAALSIQTLQLATRRPLCAVQLWCAPTREHPFFDKAARDFKVTLKVQQGDGLGERMCGAFNAAVQDYAHALLIGCDCPSLTSADLEQALLALRGGYDGVVAATEDGGYSLIGLNQAWDGLFANTRWGTPQVMAQTRNNIGRLGLRFYELPMQWDVDTPADLARYRLWEASV
ncbi:MAG: TIGR04282 family arsenosugar biosynthesis glycosyltransferase [Methylovulum sp.]|nr:TIGR04282 family arsenosugar biosynthesis glycosyltransferase [Methylovulum sp.]